MKIVYSNDSLRQRHYVPPALGNGKISIMVDKEGEMRQESYCSMTPGIVRSGKRYEDRLAQLIRFGFFEQELPGAGELHSFRQTLDLEKALCECVCRYESGLEVTSRIFCHAEREVIAIQKEFSIPTDFLFRYEFPSGPFLTLKRAGEGRVEYSSGTTGGSVALSAKGVSFAPASSPSITLLSGKKILSAEILLAFDEVLAEEDSFRTLLESHCPIWEKYWGESSISIPDEAVMKMYMTAQYHLKISSTPWSMPTGLFPLHWEGRFFAYDEFYTHGALLTSGHFAEAGKIDHFRFSILEKAIRRTCHAAICPKENLAARFPWETREDGSEGAPDGFWMDRYIHMANAAFSAWEYYSFTGDRELLEKELYPLIRACVEYIRRSGIYFDADNAPYIGKCTDMERFGEFIEKPYSTTCGSIAAFRAAACCAKLLDRDEELREKWQSLAEELQKNLPVEEDRYVPYTGCPQRSIAMYHGLFPYGVVPPEEPLQERAIADTEAHFQEFAGQYFKGGTLSAWYAGVIATAEIRRGNPEKALKLITEAANNSTGCFYECFEVYEKQKLPWFTTASGALIRAVNELLIYGEQDNIPLWGDEKYSFSLPRRKQID